MDIEVYSSVEKCLAVHKYVLDGYLISAGCIYRSKFFLRHCVAVVDFSVSSLLSFYRHIKFSKYFYGKCQTVSVVF